MTWIKCSDSLPVCPEGKAIPVIICRTGANGKPFCFGAWWANRKEVDAWNEEQSGLIAGFHEMTEHSGEDGELWTALTGVTHWQEIESAPVEPRGEAP